MPRKIFLPLEVDFDDDEKVAALSRWSKPGEARALRDLLVAMWLYCKGNTTDGHVPVEIVGKLVYPDAPKVGERDADRLVDVGICERTATGYYFPKFLKRNKSRAQIEEKSRATADAGAKGGTASGQVRAVQANAKQSASQVASHTANTENREQKSEDISVLASEGVRTETLRVVPDTEHPKNDGRCSRHPDGNPSGEPCGGCKRVEERKQRDADRAAARAVLEAEERSRNCPDCEGTNKVLNEDKTPTRRTCLHRHSRVSAAGVGVVAK